MITKLAVKKSSNIDIKKLMEIILLEVENRIAESIKNSNEYISAYSLKAWIHWKTQ